MGTRPSNTPINIIERLFNRSFGSLIGLGIGFKYSYLLIVQGRRSGREFETPVNLLEYLGKHFLVAPRGETQWVRNARVNSEVTFRRGRKRIKARLDEVSDGDKPEILKAYLKAYRASVQRFFPLPPEADHATFEKIAVNYPTFEVTMN